MTNFLWPLLQRLWRSAGRRIVDTSRPRPAPQVTPTVTLKFTPKVTPAEPRGQWRRPQDSSRPPARGTALTRSIRDGVGMVKLFALQPRPYAECPGVTFDLATRQLHLRPGFDDQVRAELVRVPPWAPFREVDAHLFERFEKTSTPSFFYPDAFAFATRRLDPERRVPPWAVLHTSFACATTLGAGTPHQDRIQQRHGRLVVEFMGPHLSTAHHGIAPSVSVFWIELQANVHAVEPLLSSHWENDPFQGLILRQLQNFAQYLTKFQPDRPLGRTCNKPFSKPRELDQVRATVLAGKPAPLILAIGRGFLFFVWKGGLHGKLELQYAGNLHVDRTQNPSTWRPMPK